MILTSIYQFTNTTMVRRQPNTWMQSLASLLAATPLVRSGKFFQSEPVLSPVLQSWSWDVSTIKYFHVRSPYSLYRFGDQAATGSIGASYPMLPRASRKQSEPLPSLRAYAPRRLAWRSRDG